MKRETCPIAFLIIYIKIQNSSHQMRSAQFKDFESISNGEIDLTPYKPLQCLFTFRCEIVLHIFTSITMNRTRVYIYAIQELIKLNHWDYHD